MSDDLTTDRIVEAAARGIYDAKHRGMANVWDWNCSGLDDEHPGVRDGYLRDARAALAAVLREAGVDALNFAAVKLMKAAAEQRSALRTVNADDLDRTAALLRALAGVADG